VSTTFLLSLTEFAPPEVYVFRSSHRPVIQDGVALRQMFARAARYQEAYTGVTVQLG